MHRPGDSYPTFPCTTLGISLSLFTWWQITPKIFAEVKFQSVEEGTNCQSTNFHLASSGQGCGTLVAGGVGQVAGQQASGVGQAAHSGRRWPSSSRRVGHRRQPERRASLWSGCRRRAGGSLTAGGRGREGVSGGQLGGWGRTREGLGRAAAVTRCGRAAEVTKV